jgi:hypothetical protein
MRERYCFERGDLRQVYKDDSSFRMLGGWRLIDRKHGSLVTIAYILEADVAQKIVDALNGKGDKNVSVEFTK